MSSRRTTYVAAWLTAALFVMGMDGCPQSRLPLGERDEGFVDPSIMGIWQDTQAEDWVQMFLGEGVTVAGNVYEARFDDSGRLIIVQYDAKGKAEVVFSGYTSLLDKRRYLNLRIIECPACEEAMYELDAGTCPYHILQYDTELPARLTGSSVGSAARPEGRLLFVGIMDEDFVAEAIEEGLIETDPACLPCVWEGSCISSEQEKLQAFVSKYDRQLYPSLNWDMYVELPEVPKGDSQD